MKCILKCCPIEYIVQEAAELQKKQTWYQQNQVTMQKEDEEEYLAFCSEAMFRIHILELRLNRWATNHYLLTNCYVWTDCLMVLLIVLSAIL